MNKAVFVVKDKKTGFVSYVGRADFKDDSSILDRINNFNQSKEYEEAVLYTAESDPLIYSLIVRLVAVQEKLTSADSIFDCLDSLSNAVDDCNDKLSDFYSRERSAIEYFLGEDAGAVLK